jgi:hypothetical protein
MRKGVFYPIVFQDPAKEVVVVDRYRHNRV